MSRTSIREILYSLIAIQSDSGTALERDIADRIAEYIKADPYFQTHTDQWGADASGDLLERPVIWALRRGKSNKTVILSGHYDAVEIDCYGSLRPYALNPDELKARIQTMTLTNEKLKKELKDANWIFGRGCGDMKAGIAINLSILLAEEEPEASILFTAVCDEENCSAGTRLSLPLYQKLKERFDLDYRVTLISEPQFRNEGAPFTIFNGGTGKLLPMIVARGRLSHCAEPMKGLNAAHIIAEITRGVDLNTDLCTEDLGVSTQPPIVQIMKDLKTTYDASLPVFAAACANILFLNSETPLQLMAKIKGICKASMRTVIDKYEESFAYARFKGLITDADHQTFAPVVLDIKELVEIAKANTENYEGFRADLEKFLSDSVCSQALSLQDASLHYMKAMIEASGLDYPMVVVGIAPPYYPAACNDYLGKDLSGVLGGIKSVVEGDYKTKFQLAPYITGMGDISYMTCANPEAERSLMGNLTLPASLYDIPFEDAAALDTPCFYMGPRSEDVHQWSERVYMPDVEHLVPDAIRRVIATI